MEPETEREIKAAQRELASALDEACRPDVDEVDTGELIKIEESLAVASKAAKQAVSLRLRRRNQSGGREDRKQETPAEVEVTHRVFDDYRGKRWHAFAVHPSSTTTERNALPESYRGGWLSFESTDEMRRVAPIPERWETLSIEDLRHLCASAPPAPKRVNKLTY